MIDVNPKDLIEQLVDLKQQIARLEGKAKPLQERLKLFMLNTGSVKEETPSHQATMIRTERIDWSKKAYAQMYGEGAVQEYEEEARKAGLISTSEYVRISARKAEAGEDAGPARTDVRGEIEALLRRGRMAK